MKSYESLPHPCALDSVPRQTPLEVLAWLPGNALRPEESGTCQKYLRGRELDTRKEGVRGSRCCISGGSIVLGSLKRRDQTECGCEAPPQGSGDLCCLSGPRERPSALDFAQVCAASTRTASGRSWIQDAGWCHRIVLRGENPTRLVTRDVRREMFCVTVQEMFGEKKRVFPYSGGRPGFSRTKRRGKKKHFVL